MSTPSAKRHRHKAKAARPTLRLARDGTIYLGLVIIGAAVVVLGFLLDGGWHALTGSLAVGYLALMAWLTNHAAYRAYRGQPMANWKQALARLPMRCVGFGAKGGKPLEAAHDAASALRMLVVSAVFSVVVLAGLAGLLIPGLW